MAEKPEGVEKGRYYSHRDASGDEVSATIDRRPSWCGANLVAILIKSSAVYTVDTRTGPHPMNGERCGGLELVPRFLGGIIGFIWTHIRLWDPSPAVLSIGGNNLVRLRRAGISYYRDMRSAQEP